ncbi:MAG: glycosyltransferase [Gemmatirosa sp.]|nr:glycosyltransferase [Gemmatirosa sp.]
MTAALDLARTPLPPRARAAARLAVLDVTEFYGDESGGVRTYLDRKAAYVARRPWLRHAVIVPGPHDALDDRDGSRLYRLGGPRVPMRPPYRFMLALRQPRRIVEHERPDVVEIGSPGLVPWVVRFATRHADTPLVHYWHSHYPRMIGGPAWSYARCLDRRFDVTIGASAYVVRELAAAGIDRVVRIPLGVDVACFHPMRRAHADATRDRLGLPRDVPIALYVGRFAREKRLDVLLRAWPAVRRRTGARLVLLGAGPERHALAPLADAAGAIWRPFEHDRARLADVVAASDLAVTASPIETFGLTVLEALASATPVLAPDHGGAAELVDRSGGGALFEAGRADALADAAVALLERSDDARRSLGMRGRAHAEREHAWEHVLDRLFALYAEVAEERWRR